MYDSMTQLPSINDVNTQLYQRDNNRLLRTVFITQVLIICSIVTISVCSIIAIIYVLPLINSAHNTSNEIGTIAKTTNGIIDKVGGINAISSDVQNVLRLLSIATEISNNVETIMNNIGGQRAISDDIRKLLGMISSVQDTSIQIRNISKTVEQIIENMGGTAKITPYMFKIMRLIDRACVFLGCN